MVNKNKKIRKIKKKENQAWVFIIIVFLHFIGTIGWSGHPHFGWVTSKFEQWHMAYIHVPIIWAVYFFSMFFKWDILFIYLTSCSNIYAYIYIYIYIYGK